jgi:hypothetical protein
MFVTQAYDTDYASGWAGRSQIVAMFMTGNSFIPVKKYTELKGSRILCRRVNFITRQNFIAFCLVTDVHKFDCMLAIKGTPLATSGK